MSSRPLGRRNRRLPAHASGSLFFRPAVSGIRFRIGCGVSFAAVLFRPVFAALPLPFPSLSHVAANPGVGLQGARPVCRSGPIALHGLFGKAIVSPTTAGRSVSDLIPRPYQTGDFASGRYGGALSHSVTFPPPPAVTARKRRYCRRQRNPFHRLRTEKLRSKTILSQFIFRWKFVFMENYRTFVAKREWKETFHGTDVSVCTLFAVIIGGGCLQKRMFP